MNSSRINFYFDIGGPALLILPDQALALQNLLALLPTRITIKYYTCKVSQFVIVIIVTIIKVITITDLILASSLAGEHSSWHSGSRKQFSPPINRFSRLHVLAGRVRYIYHLANILACFFFFTREIRSGKKEAGEEKMKKKMVVGGAHRDCFSGYLEAPPPWYLRAG